MKNKYRGIITEKEEFLYPDSILGTLPDELRIVMPVNGKPGIQLLLETEAREATMDLEGKGFQAEWYQMRKIPVEYNTGDGENQGGSMVLTKSPEIQPDYVTRKAPFWVYDCLEKMDILLRCLERLRRIFVCKPKIALRLGNILLL